jgi:lipopolysaccharide/colanic/teichoic acid biosynthesis glycosyltransferase
MKCRTKLTTVDVPGWLRARPALARSDWRRRMKRVADVTVAILCVIVVLPLMGVVGLAIKLSDGGPVLFRQSRVGRDGASFTMIKFRTMIVGAEALLDALAAQNEGAAHLFKMQRDPRITRIGGVLRRLSLDELPQLFNVIGGTMSLVGPRPHLAAEVARMPAAAQRRLDAMPGITGLWQISGRSNLDAAESIALDLRYVDSWCLSLDVRIVVGTVVPLLTGRGAS